jgi:hypothetical protein
MTTKLTGNSGNTPKRPPKTPGKSVQGGHNPPPPIVIKKSNPTPSKKGK